MVGVDVPSNTSFAGSTTAFSTGVSEATSNTNTYAVINQFRFLAAKSVRTSTIILASFNTVSAAATAAGIWYDCYTAAKRNKTIGKEVNKITCVRGAETFPFFLSVGIAIQGIIFAVAQAQGLTGIFKLGCSLTSEFVWPAIFIVPYVQLIFGVEVALRGLRSQPFPPRSKWTVPICLAIWTLSLLATGLVGLFVRAPDFCFASLIWFTAHWACGAFVLLLIITVVLAACAITIFLRLTRNANIDTCERVAASRMVYYLALGVISTAFLVPFFGWLTFNDIRTGDSTMAFTLGMIATVVPNVTGLMNGGLHLFLRSRAISTIGPNDKLAEYDRQQLKHNIRMHSTAEPEAPGHVQWPGSAGSQEALVRYEKDEESEIGSPVSAYEPRFPHDAPNPLRANSVFPPIMIPRAPDPVQLPTTSPNHVSRRPTSAVESVFSSHDPAEVAPVPLLPSTTYSPIPGEQEVFFDLDDLKPPPLFEGRQRRPSSVASSATVQIGLRLSNMKDVQRMPMTPNDPQQKVLRPSPLAASVMKSETSAGEPSPTTDEVSEPAPNPRRALPAVPHSINTEQDEPSTQLETLTPAVYSPNTPSKAKLASPKGVGFNVLRRVNTSPMQNNDSPNAAPVRRNNSDAGRRRPAEDRDDWI